jgi:hypothetical protein
MLASVARAAVNSGYAWDETIRARAIKHESPFRKHLVQNGHLKNEIRRFGTLSGNSATLDETQGGTPWRAAVLCAAFTRLPHLRGPDQQKWRYS